MFVAFLLASLVLAVTPGPGVAYIVARTLAQGRGAGLASVAGVAVGNLGNALGASLGLAALFAVSAAAFTVVKLAGAAYLLWLGVQALRRPHADAAPQALGNALRPARLLRDGFVVALLNPKTALFFGAFLPQFMDPWAAAAPQAALLGAAFVAIAAATDTGYVLLAGAVGRVLAGRGAMRAAALGRYATAATFIGLGLVAAASPSRPPR
jgi:threonine/homoserine/homoserine lactone efflux protein